MAKLPEKTNFSVTCNLLSKYMKENCSIADKGIGFATRAFDCGDLGGFPSRALDCAGKVGTNWPPTTMNLISCVEAKETSKSTNLFPQNTDFVDAKLPENSELTIFYGRKMLVFDNIPAEKARDLMQIASKGQSFTSETTSPVSAGEFASPASFPAGTKLNLSDLPIARKASLHRFLEKRKDRISAKSPYQLSHSNRSLGTHKLCS